MYSIGTILCIRSRLLRELTASLFIAMATRSDTGSHNRHDIMQTSMVVTFTSTVLMQSVPIIMNTEV
jgi:hypothetical protein